MRKRLRTIFFSKFTVAVVALVLVSAGAVYAGTQIEGTEKRSTTRVRSDGSLTQPPRPLSLDDVAKHEPGSPTAAIVRLWYWGQWGSAPNIIQAYDPAVVRLLGAADMAGAYSAQRANMVSARLRIVGESPGIAGTSVVTLQALRTNTAPEQYSFTLKRKGGRWVVVFDTLLEAAIAGYVQTHASPDPNKEPPAAAVRAGLSKARSYRVAFLCQQDSPLNQTALEPNEEC